MNGREIRTAGRQWIGQRVRYHNNYSNTTVEGQLEEIRFEDRGKIRVGGEPQQVTATQLVISGCKVHFGKECTLEFLS